MAIDAVTIKNLAAENFMLASGVRRELHAIPEVSGEEHLTTAYISRFLSERGIVHEKTSSGTGILAWIGEGEDNVLLRADIDALPVCEETGLPWASGRPGFMHACGHDVHAAILLAVAHILSSGAFESPGRTVLLFQPAEEGRGGMRTLIRDGLLERIAPRAAFALHVWPGLPAGHVALADGAVMAGVNLVRVLFTGQGGHGSYPHLAADTIAAAGAFVSGANEAASRRVDPLRNYVVSFGSIHGGSAPNVIPSAVEVQGTMRWYDGATGAALASAIRDAASSAALSYRAGFKVEIDEGYIPVVNDREATGKVGEALVGVLGAEKVGVAQPSMGSEDMGFMLDLVPGTYMQLGAGDVGAGANPLHTSCFCPEESCLETGIASMLAAMAALGGL